MPLGRRRLGDLRRYSASRFLYAPYPRLMMASMSISTFGGCYLAPRLHIPSRAAYHARMDPLALLSRTVLFNGIAVEALEPLAPAIRERSFTAGSYIFHEGDPANVLYIVV